MAYKNATTNARADQAHADVIPQLHRLDRTHYDTPGSVRACACVDCNRVRQSYGRYGRTWADLTRVQR